MRCTIRKKAVRVQLRPMPETTTREPGTSMAAATMKAADEGSPGTTTSSSSISSTCVTRQAAVLGLERHVGAAHAGARCGRGSGPGSTTVVEPSASIPAISTQDLTWALATGSGYSTPTSSAPRDGERRKASVTGLEARAHRGQRLGHAVHGPAPDRLVAVERPRPPGLPGEPARQQAHQRAGVAHVEQAAGGLERGVQAHSADEHHAVAVVLHPGPEALERARAWTPCPPTAGSCGPPPARRTSRRTSPPGARSTCRAAGCRCPGAVLRARSARCGVTLGYGEAERVDQLRGAGGLAVTRDPERHRPGAHVGGRRERHVHDVHPCSPECQRHLGDDTGAVGNRQPAARAPAGR